jgi:hypothetical protein
MATAPAISSSVRLSVEVVATFPNFRALTWHGDLLYLSRGYDLYAARMLSSPFHPRKVATYSPGIRRSLTRRFRLTSRLFRDGFHALAVLPSGNLVGAVPGAIVTLRRGEHQFHVTHRITRGTRPLHIAATPDGRVLWGEYFDNAPRSEVHLYQSCDQGMTWEVAHTFRAGSIRHVHNIVYDRWDDCMWILTGDYGSECKIIRASRDLASLDEVVAGNQQARAVAAVVTAEGIYFASDTPLEKNFIYLLDRRGKIRTLATIPSSSIYGCRNRNGMFFSTMVEPSKMNLTNQVTLTGSCNGTDWEQIAAWRKDRWLKGLFQYGNAFLPDGDNSTEFLAATTVAVQNADCVTTLWRTRANPVND